MLRKIPEKTLVFVSQMRKDWSSWTMHNSRHATLPPSYLRFQVRNHVGSCSRLFIAFIDAIISNINANIILIRMIRNHNLPTVIFIFNVYKFMISFENEITWDSLLTKMCAHLSKHIAYSFSETQLYMMIHFDYWEAPAHSGENAYNDVMIRNTEEFILIVGEYITVPWTFWNIRLWKFK
jgi:hypothetical protein